MDYFPKCINCGYCCIYYDVIIVKEEFKDELTEDMIINANNYDDIEKYFEHKPNNIRCPHLDENNKCKIHNRSYYKLTPCYKHNLNKFYLKNCPIGENRHIWEK